MYWYENQTGENTIVLSTRVRFARNLEQYPFPSRLDEEGRLKVWDRVRQAYEGKDAMAVSFGDVDEIVKHAYVETHLASRALAAKGKGSGLILSRDGEVSVMVGEEDHIRLQVIVPGKGVKRAFEKAVEWMGYAEARLPLAFREKWGYLTSCPTNLGAAMRLSVMIHLPAITRGGVMNTLTRNLNDAGFTVRGLFGEGTREGGEIYQISNQTSREKSPVEIAEAFEKMLEQVEALEKKARDTLLSQNSLEMEDQVFRALGTLKNARKMSYGEFISLYSRVRLGREAQMAGTEHTAVLDRLFVELMPAPMILRDASLSDEAARDVERSRILREKLNQTE